MTFKLPVTQTLTSCLRFGDNDDDDWPGPPAGPGQGREPRWPRQVQVICVGDPGRVELGASARLSLAAQVPSQSPFRGIGTLPKPHMFNYSCCAASRTARAPGRRREPGSRCRPPAATVTGPVPPARGHPFPDRTGPGPGPARARVQWLRSRSLEPEPGPGPVDSDDWLPEIHFRCQCPIVKIANLYVHLQTLCSPITSVYRHWLLNSGSHKLAM